MKLKLNYGKTIWVGLAFMSICAFWQMYDNVIPLILKNTFELNAKATGAIMGIDNILALFMLPLFGALSDKTKTKIGRRMPYIVAGTLVAAIGMLILPIADKTVNFVLFIMALGIVLIAMATYRSPAVALMPDVTPKPLRSKGNAVINLMGAIGGALVLGLTPMLVSKGNHPDYFPLFLTISLFMLISVALLFFIVNEPKSVAIMREQSAAAGIDETDGNLSSDTSAPAKKMDHKVFMSFILILLSIFLWFMGYNAVTSTFTRYAEEIWRIKVGDASLVLLVANIAAIISYIPVGFLATRFGRKKTILGGIVMLAFAFGSALFFKNFSSLIFVFFSLAGVGWAFINVNSYPMIVEMSKGPNIGMYTGFYYLSSMAAQTITPFVSGAFIDELGYRALFPYGCVFVALSFITMLLVKHGDSRPIPRKSTLEAFDVDD